MRGKSTELLLGDPPPHLPSRERDIQKLQIQGHNGRS